MQKMRKWRGNNIMKNMNREMLENRIHERIMAMHDSQDVDILTAQIMDDLE